MQKYEINQLANEQISILKKFVYLRRILKIVIIYKPQLPTG